MLNAKTLTSIVCLAVGTALAGCAKEQDRYVIHTDQNGQTVRLDKVTGDVMVLKGDRLVGVQTEADADREEVKRTAEVQVLAQAKFRGDNPIPQLGVTSSTLSTSWRDGRVYYRISLSPVPKRMDSWRGLGVTPFSLHLQDSSGFVLLSKDIPNKEQTTIVNEKSQPVSIEFNGSDEMSRDAYEGITRWSLPWKL